MPWGRYPGRVKAFRKWAAERTDNAELSDSATPSKWLGRGMSFRKKRRRRRKRKKENDA